MLRLDSTLRKLEIVLGGAVATTQPSFVASWSDATTGGYVGGATPGNANGVTAVTVVAAPAASTVRDVDYLAVLNRDTASATATIRYNDNSTLYPIITIALNPGDQLSYTHAHGWAVVDSSGNLHTAGVPGANGATGPQGIPGMGGMLETVDWLEEIPFSKARDILPQAWKDVTASRDIGTTYTNQTAQPIQLAICYSSTAVGQALILAVNGVQVGRVGDASIVAITMTFSALVPAGASYLLSGTFGTKQSWAELV